MAAPDRVLIDTSAWIEALRERGEAAVRARVTEAVEAGSAAVCDIVLVELWNGARSREDQETLRRIESDLECVPTTVAVWHRARKLAREARAAGLTVPTADLVVAACAEHHGLAILHRDGHFDRLAALGRRRD